MINKLGLRQEIDSRLHLLKKHLPYHESDHVLNLAYNALLDGVRLEDIELRRNDEAFLDGLGAQRKYCALQGLSEQGVGVSGNSVQV